MLFFVSLKFEKLFFFQIAQNDGYFQGIEKIRTFLGGCIILHICPNLCRVPLAYLPEHAKTCLRPYA